MTHGQHCLSYGTPAMQRVATMWEREHPNLAAPANLGMRDYRPRHAVAPPTRKRVYL